MNNKELEDYIVARVESSQGIKGVDLTCDLVARFLELETKEVIEVIEDLVDSNRIIELEFILPLQPNYGVKLFYLPAKTIVGIRERQII